MKRLKFKQKGFTLVELVIVIAIVIVLSVVSVPIYRSYVDKAKMSEGYALLGTILSAQKAYYSENGYFYSMGKSTSDDFTVYDKNIGIDARGNKYFTFWYIHTSDNAKTYWGGSRKPDELCSSSTELYNGSWLYIMYNITKGVKFSDGNYDSNW